MSFSMSPSALGASPRAMAGPCPRARRRTGPTIPPIAFTVFKEDSGPVNYYSVGEEEGPPSSAACTGRAWGTWC